jgi:hypothetical protein
MRGIRRRRVALTTSPRWEELSTTGLKESRESDLAIKESNLPSMFLEKIYCLMLELEIMTFSRKHFSLDT